MIKRYFIVVLLLSLFPAGVSAQRRAAAKKDWKTKYDYVGAVHDGRILVHRGGEGSNPRMAVFIRTAVSVIRTPAVRWSSRSSMTMPIVFPMGLPWSAKGKRTIVVSGLSIVRGVKSCPVSMRMSRVFVRPCPGTGGDGFRPPLWVCRYAGTGRNSIEIRLCPGFFRRNGSRSQRRMER